MLLKFVIFFNYIVGIIAFIVTVGVGGWDLLVRLTELDWGTTHFEVPVISLGVLIAAFALGKGILSPISDWVARIERIRGGD